MKAFAYTSQKVQASQFSFMKSSYILARQNRF